MEGGLLAVSGGTAAVGLEGRLSNIESGKMRHGCDVYVIEYLWLQVDFSLTLLPTDVYLPFVLTAMRTVKEPSKHCGEYCTSSLVYAPSDPCFVLTLKSWPWGVRKTPMTDLLWSVKQCRVLLPFLNLGFFEVAMGQSLARILLVA